MRLLTLTLSVTVHAVTTVLAAFMAGLALGAAWGGRVADRVGRPLAAYALVELGLAATGAATPAVLFRLPPVYVWLHDRLGGSALAFGAARFGLAAGVLLAPCTLMGATLPLIARAAIARADRVGRGAGALYAANTLGAVLGCVGAGFVLVPRLALGAVEILIGSSVVGGLALYARYDRLVPAAAAAMGGLGSWPRVVALVFGEAGAALLPTTLLLGATFPLVARLVVGGLDGLGTRLGAAYVWNTVGSILGAVVAGFGLLPALGMRGAFLTLVVGNLVVGTFLALAEGPRAGAVPAALAAAAGALALALVPPGLFADGFARRFGPLLFYREEAADTVMVTRDGRGQRMLRLGDGRGTAGTMTVRDDRM